MTDLGYCRMCAEIKPYANLIVINKNEFSDDNLNINLGHKILQCFQIQITPDDKLPKTICFDCCTRTDSFYEFYQKVQNAQEFLRSIVFNSTASNNVNNYPYNNCTELYAANKINTENQNSLDFIETTATTGKTSYNNNLIENPSNCVKIGDDSIKCKFLSPDQCNPLKAIEEPEVLVEVNEEVSNKFLLQKQESKKSKQVSPKNKNNDHAKTSIKFKKTISIKNWRTYIKTCYKCCIKFCSNNELVKHSEDVHGQPPEYKCPECGKCLTKYRSFAEHLKAHNNKDKFRCQVCGKTFNKKSHLTNHFKLLHELNPHLKRICTICGKIFKNPASLKNHTKNYHVDTKDEYKCDICDKKLASQGTLNIHKKVHDESTKKFQCDQCGLSFRQKLSLKCHIETKHTEINEENYVSCSLCTSRFKHREGLRVHIRYVHSDKRFECKACGKKFHKQSRYAEHMRLHTGECPFECQSCGKRFRLKSFLKIHIRQHTGEKPYRCKECNHAFTNMANYTKHMRRKHEYIASFENVKKLT